jgi:hypothetical protein
MQNTYLLCQTYMIIINNIFSNDNYYNIVNNDNYGYTNFMTYKNDLKIN